MAYNKFSSHNRTESSTIDDFERWLEDNPTGMWYGCDGFNCPWRAYVRSQGYKAGYMKVFGFDILADDIPGHTVYTMTNPSFAQLFIIRLDAKAKPECKPFLVGQKECLEILREIKGEG